MLKKIALINRHCLTAFLFFWSGFILQPAYADQQNPLLTTTAIILSQQGVYRFNRESLKPRWKNLTGMQTYHPVMGKGLLYVGSTQGLFALNPLNGEIVWHIEADKTIFSPTVSDRLYAGSLHGDLYAINPKDGSIDWRKQLSGWTYSPVVLTDRQQLWTSGQSHQASFFDINNGRLLGEIELGQEAIFSPQQLDDNYLAINLFNGSSAIVDLNTTSIVGRLDGNSQPKHLSSNGNTIYRTNRDGSLAAFDKLSHRAIWQRNLVSSDLSMHPAIPGYLLMSDLGSKLLLVDLANKKVVYQASLPEQWFLPVQVNREAIVYFKKDRLQPDQLQAVKISAGST